MDEEELETCTCGRLILPDVPNQSLHLCPVHQPRLYELWRRNHG